MSHRMGPAAGIAALRQAAEAAQRGLPAAEYARDHPELDAALAQFRN